MEKIVEKMVGELQGQLKEKKVRIDLSPAASAWLAEKGFDPTYGARPLRRLIMQEIGDVLSDEILFGNLTKGGTAKIGVKGKKLLFNYT
jgi:ATP-dependent Clp protease ATP-binding subunit ClpA